MCCNLLYASKVVSSPQASCVPVLGVLLFDGFGDLAFTCM